MRREGIDVDIGERMPIEQYMERCAKARLVWSPEGYGKECFRHYEAALCGSVPVISRAPRILHRPLQDCVDPVFLRLFNPIGVGQQPPFLVPNLVGQLLETRKGVLRLAIENPGTVRDFVDVRDVARAVLDVIRLPVAGGLKLNVCSGRATALSDLARLPAGVAGRRCEIVAEDVDEAKIPYQCGS